MPVTLHLFGAPAIHLGDGTPPIALPFERRSQLIVLLALKRAWVGRAELAAMLWPDQTDKLAFTNLRKTLFRLQGLAWGAPLQAQGHALRFEARTDMQDFEQALGDKRLEDALALYRGALLTGFDDDANEAWTGWLHFERQRLHAAWRAAALEHLAGEVNAAEGAALAARLLAADPLDEAALRCQIALLVRAGQPSHARQLYREFAGRLHDELGIGPGAGLQALHDAIGTATGASLSQARHAARDDAGDAGFVGRAVERRRIIELLGRDDVRLLCLTGPGGIGKTRLAQRVQAEVAIAFDDGALFVPLEDVGTPAELPARLARETGVVLRDDSEPLAQLTSALRDRRMLLVLDNFEHLLEATPTLDALLAACPFIKLLVTSRLRLGLAAEQLMPLEGLLCPEREDADRIDAFDASRLFVAAAQRVEPALVPSAEAAAIVDICRQVDGLPLAIELAASFTRLLSCEAIADELRRGTEWSRVRNHSVPRRSSSAQNGCARATRRGRHATPASRSSSSSRGSTSQRPNATRWRAWRCSAAASRRRRHARSPGPRYRC